MSQPSPLWERNPYAPSPAVLAGAPPAAQREIAPRGVRLVAHLIDTLILGLTVLPAAIGLGLDLTHGASQAAYLIPGGVLTLLAGTAWAAVSLHLVSRNGQSIGKRLLSIKVVRRDGSPASLGRIFWLRNVVNSLPLLIPLAGQLYALLDALMVFGQPQQCLHDQIADTQVVRDR
jgi:uncharacterized RDD family membrane protein YckC